MGQKLLDQYKERKPRDPTIREKFNNYRFSNHKELAQRPHIGQLKVERDFLSERSGL